MGGITVCPTATYAHGALTERAVFAQSRIAPRTVLARRIELLCVAVGAAARPGFDDHPVAHLETLDSRPNLCNFTHGFMSEVNAVDAG